MIREIRRCGHVPWRVQGERRSDARLAFGGWPRCRPGAAVREAALIEQGWSSAGIEACIAALDPDFETNSRIFAAQRGLPSDGSAGACCAVSFFICSNEARKPRCATADALDGSEA